MKKKDYAIAGVVEIIGLSIEVLSASTSVHLRLKI